MKQYILLLLIFLGFNLSGYSQIISGKVSDENGPIEGVQIRILDSQDHVNTNDDGLFQIEVDTYPANFEFSKEGYEVKFLKIFEGTEVVKVILFKKADQLAEVVLYSSVIPEKIRRTPASVSLIDKNSIKSGNNFNLVQNLNRVPGVFVGQGALNTNKLNIRGIGSRAQYGTNRIKGYINGIPLTTAEGELTIDDIDPQLIDRIEVHKGPVSSMFGAGLGGAINLYTLNPAKNHRNLKAGYDYGSFNTRKINVGFNRVQDSLGFHLNYHQLLSDGYRANGNYERIGLNGTANYLNKLGNRWTLFYSYLNLKAHIPSSLNEQDFLYSPQKAAFTWNASGGYESYDKNILGLSYSHAFSAQLKNETSVFANSRDGYEPRPFNILDDDILGVGLRTRFNMVQEIINLPAEIGFGAEAMLEKTSVATYENLYRDSNEQKSIQGERLSFNEQNRKYLNVFSQLNMQITTALTAEAGFNFNTTSYKLDDKFNSDEKVQSGEYNFDPVISPRFGLSYEAFDSKNFYASLSHGFSTPTVSETLTPEGLINTELKPEKGWNYEIGFKGSWLENRLYTELSLYTIRVSDLLVAQRIGEDQYIGINAGKAHYNGVEFFSQYRLDMGRGSNLQFELNSAFNFHKFEEFIDRENNFSGNDLPAIPKYSLSPSVEYNIDNWKFYLNMTAVGEMALNDENSVFTDAYAVTNFKLMYHWLVGQSITAEFNMGVNNLFDEQYASSIVPNAMGFGGAAPRYYYPGKPRNFYGGVIFRFDL
ncbi:TonB-dependent receptor domain-containing protein [Christiangramia aquimixticola]|uniref:TonB-dependent receptor domain-containing protein n=1 Tax=Christiangramia aquimixticola TaxID=1697558 RepID=UPI003AA8AAF0